MKINLPALALVCFVSAAQATEWHVLGPRPMGMGGAGVALPQGAQSAYWNPAALAIEDNPSGLQVPIGAHLAVTGPVLRGAKDLNQVASDCRSGGAGCTNANISNALTELNNPNNGVRGDMGGGAGLKVGRLSVFVNDFAFVGAKPIIDMVHNNIAVGATNIQSNTSALQLRGINVTEIGAAYGHDLPFAPGLNAGIALKGMLGKVGYQSYGVVASDPGTAGLGNLMKNSRTSFQPGVDLGLLWDVNRSFESAWFKPRLGLAGRNLNNPRFNNPDAARAAGLSSKYSIQGSARLGLAITPLSFWNVAADADLTKNLTAVEGVKQQTLALGTEINVFNRPWLNIPLRGGLSKNIAMSGSRTALSAGFGLNFLHVNFDLGATVTPSRETVQTQGKTKKLPNEISVAGQFAVLFGGTGKEDAAR